MRRSLARDTPLAVAALVPFEGVALVNFPLQSADQWRDTATMAVPERMHVI